MRPVTVLVLLLAGVVGFAWGWAADEYGLTIWHALAIAAVLGIIGFLRHRLAARRGNPTESDTPSEETP